MAIYEIFDERIVSFLNIFGIATPEKVTCQGVECYNVPSEKIVKNIQPDQVEDYVKILIFSYIFEIGNGVMIGNDGKLVPFDNTYHNKNIETILDDNDIFDEVDFGDLCYLVDGVDCCMQMGHQMKMITRQCVNHYMSILNTDLVSLKLERGDEEYFDCCEE
ncbi:043R [Cherax quadricarinatus iridovirus]|uniref:Uncharacterized protein n=1 Tax=Shrimp hemocyte iridescent virus TaxID=2039780 RepID=A0A291B0V0_9VIRU|nr:043R [Cherax quadricarinatus iridovirus]YP_010084861.1 hypothetical protein KM509_gp109 [Shrimp hemocyte iridescent virus]UPA43361.1 hypothetical protein 4TH000087 [Iridovirus CN01]ASZ85023.1 043R [Cherax quadricarinatus iridovirus]ATE87118.1 hypothetical protein [Shrimp hemocyte iridescent virus]UPA43437.1 hypothetical protein 3TG000004 [Iridovirus CN01]UPA43631.1 hypothetical protein 1DG000039 [Iridovirus CN01]